MRRSDNVWLCDDVEVEGELSRCENVRVIDDVADMLVDEKPVEVEEELNVFD